MMLHLFLEFRVELAPAEVVEQLSEKSVHIKPVGSLG